MKSFTTDIDYITNSINPQYVSALEVVTSVDFGYVIDICNERLH